MTYKEFIKDLCETYNEKVTEKNVKLRYLNEWLMQYIKEDHLNSIFKKVVQNFKPTATVPFPLIPHIKEIINFKRVRYF